MYDLALEQTIFAVAADRDYGFMHPRADFRSRNGDKSWAFIRIMPSLYFQRVRESRNNEAGNAWRSLVRLKRGACKPMVTKRNSFVNRAPTGEANRSWL